MAPRKTAATAAPKAPRKKAAPKPKPTPAARKARSAVPVKGGTRNAPMLYNDFTQIVKMESLVNKISFDYIRDKSQRYTVTTTIVDHYKHETITIETDTSSFYVNDVKTQGKNSRWVRNFGFPALTEIRQRSVDNQGRVCESIIPAPIEKSEEENPDQTEMNFGDEADDDSED